MSKDKPPASGLVGYSAVSPRLDERRCTAVSGPAITLDPATSSDEEFFYRTFASTRAAEVALTGWSAEQQESFLRMQFEAQRRGYLMQTPDAQYWVIRQDGTSLGRMIVDRTPKEIHLIDIGLLAEFRGRGIGSTLMAAIMQEAAQEEKDVRLFVERFNPALRWYERLGFKVISGEQIYLEMLWSPACEKAGETTSVGDPEAEYVDVSE